MKALTFEQTGVIEDLLMNLEDKIDKVDIVLDRSIEYVDGLESQLVVGIVVDYMKLVKNDIEEFYKFLKENAAHTDQDEELH
ncbi:hypothetical protein SDC9_72286 [bioreactor metagenome]|uniref:Uncharacterized protein n=1 Tax=bioreactor metagenome TaxID=1076179 RepID=A0A644YB60_9ZZZZ